MGFPDAVILPVPLGQVTDVQDAIGVLPVNGFPLYLSLIATTEDLHQVFRRPSGS
jgi:hypothetical protein